MSKKKRSLIERLNSGPAICAEGFLFPVPLQKGHEESNNSILPLPLQTAHFFSFVMENMVV